MQKNRVFPGMIAAVALTLAPLSALAQGSPQIERGRYMVLTGHCNNCHTAGYAPKEGPASSQIVWPAGWIERPASRRPKSKGASLLAA